MLHVVDMTRRVSLASTKSVRSFGGRTGKVLKPVPGILDDCACGGFFRGLGFAQYLTMPARHCYTLPERVSLDAGVLVEPAATAVMAVRKAGL